MIKKLHILALALVAAFMVACNEDIVPSQVETPAVEVNKDLGGFTLDSVDVDDHMIYVSPSKKGGDSLSFNGLCGFMELPEGYSAYLATTTDMDDPDVVNWDYPIKDDSGVSMKDTSSVSIVVLDEKNRPVAIWNVVNTAATTSSSSVTEVNSATSSSEESADSEETVESSATEGALGEDIESAASSASEDEVYSSSEESVESSSDAESSNSAEEGSSASEKVVMALSDLKVVYNGEEIEPVVTDHKVYFELPYGADLTQVKLNSEDGEKDLTRAVSMNFKNEDGVEEYSVVAGVQLPGSDFSKRVDSFWGTTSDAMAGEGTGSYIVSVNIKSSANAEFESSKLTLTSKLVVGSGWGIDGGWKLSGGFYYAGSFSGTDASYFYKPDPSESSACADNCPADVSPYMTFGKPFNGRPSSFAVKYSYEHVDNKSSDYPQKSLIYVVLVSADRKIVAAGTITDDESKGLSIKNVDLKYGSDAGLLSEGYVGVSDLKKGSGDEDVASIRVMFASSAYAFVADGGSKAYAESRYRGGENAQLILDDFKLNY